MKFPLNYDMKQKHKDDENLNVISFSLFWCSLLLGKVFSKRMLLFIGKAINENNGTAWIIVASLGELRERSILTTYEA